MTDTHTGSPVSAEPTDEELVAHISSMDVMDVPSRHEFIGNPAMLKPMTKVTALAPKHREGILQELRDVPPEQREAREAELVQAKVVELARGYRKHAGFGDGATEFHKVSWEVSREVSELESRMDEIIGKLAEVEHIDPQTGKLTMRYAEGSVRRNALEGDLRMMEHQVNALKGPVGDRRIKAAMEKSIANERARRAELADAAEVNRLAAQKARQDGIERRAAIKARFMRSNIGD